jgi:branched-chain amino acid transport system ATP-binding protein
VQPGRGRVLEVKDVGVSFGAVKALDGVSLEVPEGSFVGLIGPNGAGKTTLFNVVSGFVAPSQGRVRLCGRRITDWSPPRRARAGIARTFQNVGLDKHATVADNLRVAREGGPLGAELRSIFSGNGSGPGPRAADIVERLDLHPVLSARVDQLSVGTTKLVELACALTRDPRLLLLDEPSSGLGATERIVLAEVLGELRGEGLTVLLIEHDMQLAMNAVDFMYVLDFGVMLAQGRPAEIRRDKRVIEAYLGKSAS